ncbi:MAG: TetR/AcrR family transcriptional regulator [Actinomycetota bacterium]|nr:TetR/AcrR family transcriptional regulator [Actinomycetota bacterium]
MPTTENTKMRRRGAELEREIYEASFDELMRRGCSQFSIEGVAATSGASKASIYRRWRDREDLIIDTIDFYFPQIVRETPVGDAFVLLQGALDEVVGFFNSDHGQIAYNLLIESRRSKRLSEIFDRAIAEPRRDYFRRIMSENYQNSELSIEDLNKIANVASSLLIYNVFVNGLPVDLELPNRILGEIIRPLVIGLATKPSSVQSYKR